MKCILNQVIVNCIACPVIDNCCCCSNRIVEHSKQVCGSLARGGCAEGLTLQRASYRLAMGATAAIKMASEPEYQAAKSIAQAAQVMLLISDFS